MVVPFPDKVFFHLKREAFTVKHLQLGRHSRVCLVKFGGFFIEVISVLLDIVVSTPQGS